MLSPRDPFQIEKYRQTKSKGVEKDISCKWKGKRTGVAVVISDKIDFKTKARVTGKGHYIMLKGTIQQEDITLVNIYTPDIGTPKYVKQVLMNIKGEINRNTVIVRDFNTPLTSMDRSFRQKITKETAPLKNTPDQMI